MASLLPEINAIIACYLPAREGDYFRERAGDIGIKSIIDGKTCRNGTLHSYNDQPIFFEHGLCEWFAYGKRHRGGDRPAVVCTDPQELKITDWREWWINGKRHREGDKPARIFNDRQEWWINGKRHREGDKPAIVYRSGYMEWRVNGLCHRDGGKPAIIYSKGDKEYWVNGSKQNNCAIH